MDEEFDAMLLLKEENNSKDETKPHNVYIFKRLWFEYMFSFKEFYENEIVAKTKEIEDKALLSDVKAFINLCKDDARKIKKFDRIVRSEIIDKLTKDKIKQVISDFSLKIGLDTSGMIIADKNNIWDVLRILDDDYLKSDSTSLKYEAH